MSKSLKGRGQRKGNDRGSIARELQRLWNVKTTVRLRSLTDTDKIYIKISLRDNSEDSYSLDSELSSKFSRYEESCGHSTSIDLMSMCNSEVSKKK